MMDREVAVVVAAVVGGALALQPPLNSMLGRTVGGAQAAMLTVAVSLALLIAVAAVAGGFGGVARAGEAPWWALAGAGVIGAAYVASIVWTVRALGAGGLTAVTIAGQLTVAVLVDHFGWLGVERSPITVTRVTGLALLAAGAFLVVRD